MTPSNGRNTSLRTPSLPADWPADVRPEWFNVIRRLQSVARTQQGLAVLTIAVFVNADGHPIKWTEPKRLCLEPKGTDAQFLEFLDSII